MTMSFIIGNEFHCGDMIVLQHDHAGNYVRAVKNQGKTELSRGPELIPKGEEEPIWDWWQAQTPTESNKQAIESLQVSFRLSMPQFQVALLSPGNASAHTGGVKEL
jgi:hypothetical protein